MEGRDVSLDWVRGALVAVMVCHHGVEYFDAIDSWVLRYLDFVTGAFVFAALFTTGQAARQTRRVDPGRAQRAIWRSVKLIALFSALNLIIHSLVNRNYNGTQFGINEFSLQLASIYLAGNKRLANFEILLPIAYAQLIARCSSFSRYGQLAVQLLILVGVVSCLSRETVLFNVYYVTIGLVAYDLGRRIDLDVWRRRQAARYGWLYPTAALFLSVLVMSLVKTDNILWYSFVVIAMCIALNAAALRVIGSMRWWRWLPLVGRYSLFGYLFHIAVLQALVRSIDGWHHGGVTGALVIASVFLVVVATVMALEWIRRRLKVFDYGYRAVFA